MKNEDEPFNVARFLARMPAELKEMINAAAKLRNMPAHTWARATLDKAATDVLRDEGGERK